MKKTISAYLILVSLFSACGSGGNTESSGDKYAEVFKKYETSIKEIRKFLSEIKSTLPEVGNERNPIGEISPALNLGDYDTTGNTIILQFHLLNNPELFFSNDSLFGLYYNMLALDAFKWTGITKERMILEKDYLSDKEVEKIVLPLSTSRFPYLVVVKPTEFQKVIQGNEGKFEGGSATASFYLYDLRSKKLLTSTSITAAPDDEMNFAYEAGSGDNGKYTAANKMIKETVQKNMKLKVYEWLKEITNNTAIVPAQ